MRAKDVAAKQMRQYVWSLHDIEQLGLLMAL